VNVDVVVVVDDIVDVVVVVDDIVVVDVVVVVIVDVVEQETNDALCTIITPRCSGFKGWIPISAPFALFARSSRCQNVYHEVMAHLANNFAVPRFRFR